MHVNDLFFFEHFGISDKKILFEKWHSDIAKNSPY